MRAKQRKTFFFFSEGLHMLTCALDGYKKKCKCDSRHTSFFFFFNIFITNKALLYLKQFLKIYNPLALFNLLLTHRREIGKAHN